MNEYIYDQILNMIVYTKTFERACELAATKDDDVIDKNEEKLLKQIHSMSLKYRNKLNKLKR